MPTAKGSSNINLPESAVSSVPVGWQLSPIYSVWDVDGTLREVSPSNAALIGRTVEEVVGQRWPDLLPGHEEFAWQQYRMVVETLRTAPLMVVDSPTISDGEFRWFRWTEWAVRDAAGELIGVRSTAVDVTELHDAREALSSLFDSLVQARSEGRQEVVERLHNGAVQQLVAARWALGMRDADAARSLVDDALAAVRVCMETLDPVPTVPEVATRSRATDNEWWLNPSEASIDRPLPAEARAALTDTLSDAVAVLSSTGSIRMSTAVRRLLFDDSTTVDIASMLAAVHRDDRDGAATALVEAFDGQSSRLTFRYRHPTRGWRRFACRLSPLPFVVNGPKLVAVVALDITDDIGHADVGLIEAQLAERERIARDLHDDALQQLSGLRWMLGGHDTDPAVLEQLEVIDTAIRGQLANLNSAVARFGLEQSLQHLIDRMSSPVTGVWPAALDALPAEVAETLFRSAREALRNVDQHARASAATLTIEVQQQRVVLTVSDDGVGVGPAVLAAAAKAGHLGVSTMREAVLGHGGSFELAMQDSGGTRLRLAVPLS